MLCFTPMYHKQAPQISIYMMLFLKADTLIVLFLQLMVTWVHGDTLLVLLLQLTKW